MSKQSQDNKNPADGHRARLLERYLKSGIESLHDYEILELLLTYALPRRDTKPIAKKLLAAFGSLSAAMSAPVDELCEIGGLTERSAALICLFKDTMQAYMSETFVNKHVLAHRRDIEEYLRFKFGHYREECLIAIFLVFAHHVIGTEVVTEGTVNRTIVFPRKVIQRALKCGAAAFIIAHNHPAGNIEPSESDWAATNRLMDAAECMEIRFVDHIIVSKDRAVSMRDYDRWPSWAD